MKTSSFFFLAMFSLLFFQCKKENVLPPQTVDFSCADQPTVCDLTAANGNFAIDIFKKINSEEPSDKNIFISPFSISTALTMTANGAADQTLEKMRNTLKINDLELASVNASYKTLLETLPNLDANTKLKIANSIWPQVDFPVLPGFLQTNSTNFDSEVIPVDFKNATPVIAQVNGWVKDKTEGLIPETLTSLPDNLVMLLINAIYFKGTWRTEFDPEDTHQADFFAPSGAVPVDMMHIQESDFAYFQNGLFQAIDLPYGDSIYSMSVFLPSENHTVNDIIAEMNPAAYNMWLSSFYKQPVELFLPKFKMGYDIRLKKTLSDMGMAVAFSDNADFSKISTAGHLAIGDVIHKAVVEVSEKGTEAAAVTVVEIINTSIPVTPIVNVNRPFLFVIRDNKTKCILFMGKIVNPES